MLLQKETAIILKTGTRVAIDSPDHMIPVGTRQDNSTNPRFNEKLYRLFSEARPQLRVLDLGCAGGGFVHMCLNDGCLAVGLEGSDYSKIYQRASWPFLTKFLHTCDITKPFRLSLKDGKRTKQLTFHTVTAWEVLEHIKEKDLDTLLNNMRSHLAHDGIIIVSISPTDDIRDGVQLHQTVQPKAWWIKKFAKHGLRHDEGFLKYFNHQFVRGGGKRDTNFVLTLVHEDGEPPAIPRLTFKDRMIDRWFCSTAYRMLRRLVP